MYDWLGLDARRLATPHAVEKNSRPNEIPVASALARDRGAVAGVENRRPLGQRRQRLTKTTLLLVDAAIVELGGVEVRERTLRWKQLDELPDLANVAPRNACPAHSRVDRQMPRASTSLPPGFDLRGKAECRSETGRADTRQLVVQDWREDDDRSGDSESTQLFALGDCRDAEAPRIQRLECAHRGSGAEAVGICLDHGKKRDAGAPRCRRGIALQRAKIDVDPGAS